MRGSERLPFFLRVSLPGVRQVPKEIGNSCLPVLSPFYGLCLGPQHHSLQQPPTLLAPFALLQPQVLLL